MLFLTIRGLYLMIRGGSSVWLADLGGGGGGGLTSYKALHEIRVISLHEIILRMGFAASKSSLSYIYNLYASPISLAWYHAHGKFLDKCHRLLLRYLIGVWL